MIIVTGGTGFIGRRLVPVLVKKYGNKNILCLIKKSDTQYEKDGRKVLSQLKVKTKLIDLDSGYGLKNLPEKISYVFHLAARTDTSEKGHNITNNLGTKALVEALNLSSKSHFIYTSTTAFMSGRINCSTPITEKSTPSPTNEYGRSKLAAEKYLIGESRKKKFKLTILRFPTVYGEYPRKNSFFDLVDTFARKKSIFSRINWPGKTSIVHVDDAANIISMLVRKAKKTQENVFIVSAESISFAKINEILYSERKLKFRKIKLPLFFWTFSSFGRKITPFFENIFPPKLYNLIWRAGLLVDNVIDCKSVNLPTVLPNYKFKRLVDTIKPLVTSITKTELKNNSRSTFSYILLSFLFVINFIFLWKMLNVTIPDDDWLGILFYKSKLTTTLFNPYGLQHISFGKLYEMFGYNPSIFYSFSIILRSFAAISISLFVYYFTSNKWGALLSGILFSVSYIGFETTEVANNSNSYLAIILMLIFIKIFVTNFEKHNLSVYIIGSMLYLALILAAPIRVYMFPLWILSLWFSMLFQTKNDRKIVYLFIWPVLIGLLTLILVRLGTFGETSSVSNSFLNSFKNSFVIIFNSLINGEQKYIRFFATGISNIIIPDSVIGHFKKLQYPEFYLGAFYITLSGYYVLRGILSKSRTQLQTLIIAFLAWIPLFFLVAWLVWLGREPIIVSYRRYLTIPFSGFCVTVGLVFALLKNKKLQTITFSVLILMLICVHYFALSDYINLISKYRNNKLEKLLLNELKTNVTNLPTGVSLFYFDDQEHHEDMYNTFYLGFSTKLAVLYDIDISTTGTRPPHYTNSLTEIREAVQTGDPLVKHGFEATPLPMENIFAFRIEGNKLINIKNDLFKD